MSIIQYEPVNTLCVNTYNNNVGNINNEPNTKQKLKALAFMNQGQGMYDINYEKINSCVMPNETLTTMDLDNNTCYLRNNNNIINANFKKSTGGSLGSDRNLAQIQIKQGAGVYPNNGCSISTSDSVMFKQAIQDSANTLDFENNKILVILKNKIQQLKDKITDLQNNAIPNEQNLLNNAINTYNSTLNDCNYNVQLKNWLLNIIPRMKNIINNNLNYNQSLSTDYWNNVNNYGKSLAQSCNSTSDITNNTPHPVTTRQQNKCLDVFRFDRSDLAPIVTWDCWGGPNQKWKMDDQQRIVSDYDGKCLDVYAGGTSEGQPVVQYQCHGGFNQKWVKDDQHRLHPRHAPNMCLDSREANNGTQLTISTCGGGNNQKFDGIQDIGYSVQQGYDYPGYDIGSKRTNNSSECKDWCDQTNDCKGYVTDGSGQQCWIKNRLENGRYAGNRNSYTQTPLGNKYRFKMKNNNSDIGTMYPGDNGTVNGNTYCSGYWGSVSPGQVDDNGNFITPRIDGQNKNMRCVGGTTYSDPRGGSYNNMDVDCDSVMANVAGGGGQWGYRCV